MVSFAAIITRWCLETCFANTDQTQTHNVGHYSKAGGNTSTQRFIKILYKDPRHSAVAMLEVAGDVVEAVLAVVAPVAPLADAPQPQWYGFQCIEICAAEASRLMLAESTATA